MPLNIQTLKTRALTAIIFVVIMLVGLLYNYWSFFLLFSVIHFGCWVEYQKLMGLIDDKYSKISNFHKYIIMICGFSFMMANVLPEINNTIHTAGQWIFIACFVLIPVFEILLKWKEENFRVLALSFVGLAYISLSWGLMIDLNNICPFIKDIQNPIKQTVFSIPIILIASIWINDTMAYIVGSLIGKTPLSKISPKKTWEGTIGGAVLAVIVVTTLCYTLIGEHMLFIAIGISTIAAFIGTLGDLLESKLKRMANVKDSGSFMPGHGGFLDRFDSLLLATPFVWLLMKLI